MGRKEGISAQRDAELKREEISVRREGDNVAWMKWQHDFSRAAVPQKPEGFILQPLDAWHEHLGDTKDIVPQRELEQYRNELLYLERFDLYYALRQRSGTRMVPMELDFFSSSKEVRTKVSELITEGRKRSATYLLRTVEEFFPQLGIQATEFKDALPAYPTLIVEHKNMEATKEGVESSSHPMQDLLSFYVQEALLADLLFLKDELEKVAAAPTLSDEAKDGPLRSLRLSVDDRIRTLEGEIDSIATRTGMQFVRAIGHRYHTRFPHGPVLSWNPALWRDGEDALNAITSIREKLKYESTSTSRWGIITTQVLEFYKLKLRPIPSSKGEVRAKMDHLYDLVHNGGSVMSWLSRKPFEGDEVPGLNQFPLAFLEFRNGITTAHPAADFVALFRELYTLTSNEKDVKTFLKYRERFIQNTKETASIKTFKSRFPRMTQTIGSRDNTLTFLMRLAYAVQDEHQIRWPGGRIGDFVPIEFLDTMDAAIQEGDRKAALLRTRIENMKRTYGLTGT